MRFFDLVEAEGRAFRKSSIAVVESMLVVFFGFCLMFFGIVVAGISLFLWLAARIGNAGAALAVAVGLMVLGILLLVRGHRSAQQGRSVFAESADEVQPVVRINGEERGNGVAR